MTQLKRLTEYLRKKPKIILLAVYIIILLLLIFWAFPRHTRINPKRITKVRIQNGLNGEITIVDDPESIKELTNALSKVYYCFGFESGKKGWLYWLKFYTDDKTVAHEFTINGSSGFEALSTRGISKESYLRYFANTTELKECVERMEQLYKSEH